MELTFFSGVGWESWDVEARPAIPKGMPVLVDDDLRFDGDGDGDGGPRPSVAVNRWLRELPFSGAPSPGTWAVYACVLRDWVVFCSEHGTDVFAGREDLKAVLGAYAVHRADGPEQARFAATTWNRHVSVLSCFYQWAVAEGHASGVPFTYAQAQVRYGPLCQPDSNARQTGPCDNLSQIFRKLAFWRDIAAKSVCVGRCHLAREVRASDQH